ncbi:MAG TPA: sigma-70 family RNA polymerase sigma factor [Pyrinomonadaceae bacterium]|nr:sigma-70 family RNA polymerase sigma factor [Pyrinomonadaceae bacterium]
MTKHSPAEITSLLLAWSRGQSSALDQLIPLVHDELHRIAKRYMRRERPGQTIQTTALVNEAYLRLIDSSRVHWQNRVHFFAIAAQLMRRVLVDFARRRHNLKAGGAAPKVSLDQALVVSRDTGEEMIALDDALKTLASLDARQSQVVELRFFGGLSLNETAQVLNISEGTVRRDWSLAKAWLHRELSGVRH